MSNKIIIGCVADDFTGASDAASFLVKGGLPTVLLNGISGVDIPEGVKAAVVALKTRTEEREKAVSQSLEAIRWLRGRGAEQVYIKYCSTFDSTPEGNIGPICDAALKETGGIYTVLCPSLPENGRIVKGGRLYVDGVPLEQTHMAKHPLTPMWSSCIQELMKGQSLFPCVAASPGDEGFWERLREMEEKGSFYVVPDYASGMDGEAIAEAFGDLPLLTGGSGLLYHLARRKSSESKKAFPKAGVEGKAVILAGSCSVATQGQVKSYMASGGKGIMITPGDAEKEISPKEGDIMFYSSGSAGLVKSYDPADGAMLERALSALAVKAVKAGYNKIIVAGGETSGAVTKALGYSAFKIGESIAPGTPVMFPLEAENVRLVLKSGNFGQEDFFQRAINILKG